MTYLGFISALMAIATMMMSPAIARASVLPHAVDQNVSVAQLAKLENAVQESNHQSSKQSYSLTSLATLERAYSNRVSNLQVLVQGRVVSILPDDNDGDRHQRFILRLANSQTLLVAHNIDVAPRVAGLQVGDSVYVYGEYEWNDRGGVIHWTHHDPNGRHVGGWIDRNGAVYR
ncbi:MAG: DUF3465 domain-containing protein [Elainellaceae cyanobacterium]